MTNKNQFNAIVFDFDGTLIDSAPSILDAFSSALREEGITPQVQLDSSLIGPPLAETLMRLCGSNESRLIQSLSEKFKRHYDVTGVATTNAYPGVESMLERLTTAGSALHICTNKRLSVTRAILERLGWKNMFASVYALDMTEPRITGKRQLLSKQIVEQNIDTSNAIFVGDKQEDGLAAKTNGMNFYYASWGYGDLQHMQLETNWNWLNHPNDLCSATG